MIFCCNFYLLTDKCRDKLIIRVGLSCEEEEEEDDDIHAIMPLL